MCFSPNKTMATLQQKRPADIQEWLLEFWLIPKKDTVSSTGRMLPKGAVQLDSGPKGETVTGEGTGYPISYTDRSVHEEWFKTANKAELEFAINIATGDPAGTPDGRRREYRGSGSGQAVLRIIGSGDFDPTKHYSRARQASQIPIRFDDGWAKFGTANRKTINYDGEGAIESEQDDNVDVEAFFQMFSTGTGGSSMVCSQNEGEVVFHPATTLAVRTAGSPSVTYSSQGDTESTAIPANMTPGGEFSLYSPGSFIGDNFVNITIDETF